MKKNLLKWSLLAFMLVSNLVMFAQDPDSTEGGEGPPLEGGDQPTPINGMLVYLAVAGILFAVYYFSKMQKQKLQA
jgi:hypothetical protein